MNNQQEQSMENNKHQQRFSPEKRILSFRYAIRGIMHMMGTQHNAWIHLGIAIAVIIAGVLLGLSHAEWILLALTIGFVFTTEAFNTAVELLVDKVSPHFDPVAGKVKDIAAGAVLISAASAAVVGLILFLPKIMG